MNNRRFLPVRSDTSECYQAGPADSSLVVEADSASDGTVGCWDSGCGTGKSWLLAGMSGMVSGSGLRAFGEIELDLRRRRHFIPEKNRKWWRRVEIVRSTVL